MTMEAQVMSDAWVARAIADFDWQATLTALEMWAREVEAVQYGDATLHASLTALIPSTQEALVFAASRNQVGTVQKLVIAKELDVNGIDRDGRTALCAAAQGNNMDTLRVLCQLGADINQQQANGSTPLHEACSCGQEQAVAMLLMLGARTDMLDERGRAPLHCACRHGHTRVVRMLLNANVDPFLIDDSGATPFDVAMTWKHIDVLFLIEDYVSTRFQAVMQARAMLAFDTFDENDLQLPTALETHVCTFLA